jgi:hypothetical protein
MCILAQAVAVCRRRRDTGKCQLRLIAEPESEASGRGVGDGNLDRQLGQFLALYIREISEVIDVGAVEVADVYVERRLRQFAVEELGGLAKGSDGVDVEAVDHGRIGRQPNDDRGEIAVTGIHLDLTRVRIDPVNGTGIHGRQQSAPPAKLCALERV